NNGVVIHLQGFSYLMRLEGVWFVLSLRDLRNQLRNRELILNNGVVIHLQGFSYLMRLEAECFALSLRDLRN
ncbi:hypothetical protein, partial [Klebsiella sp. GW_Kp182]|uniref:hypothetical protein n=1 Tax=Klebsiella sp. GW_Kp182 TaxID=3153493 RepID=UPI0032B42FA2